MRFDAETSRLHSDFNNCIVRQGILLVYAPFRQRHDGLLRRERDQMSKLAVHSRLIIERSREIILRGMETIRRSREILRTSKEIQHDRERSALSRESGLSKAPIQLSVDGRPSPAPSSASLDATTGRQSS